MGALPSADRWESDVLEVYLLDTMVAAVAMGKMVYEAGDRMARNPLDKPRLKAHTSNC